MRPGHNLADARLADAGRPMTHASPSRGVCRTTAPAGLAPSLAAPAGVPVSPSRGRLELVAVGLDEANVFVAQHHRHHKPVVGHKFSLGAVFGDVIVGVAIVGRPVARLRDDGQTLEVTRLCTDGTRNACSFLYGAAAKAAFALGYCRIGTYTLPEEGGASLRGVGWKLIGERGGGSWSCASRPRVDTYPLQKKLLWEASL